MNKEFVLSLRKPYKVLWLIQDWFDTIALILMKQKLTIHKRCSTKVPLPNVLQVDFWVHLKGDRWEVKAVSLNKCMLVECFFFLCCLEMFSLNVTWLFCFILLDFGRQKVVHCEYLIWGMYYERNIWGLICTWLVFVCVCVRTYLVMHHIGIHALSYTCRYGYMYPPGWKPR